MTTTSIEREAHAASYTLPSPRRRPRRAVPPPPDWACVNCTQPNTGRRRRCCDCGTSRF